MDSSADKVTITFGGDNPYEIIEQLTGFRTLEYGVDLYIVELIRQEILRITPTLANPYIGPIAIKLGGEQVLEITAGTRLTAAIGSVKQAMDSIIARNTGAASKEV